MKFFSPRARVRHSGFDTRLEALLVKCTGRVEGASESRGHHRIAKVQKFFKQPVIFSFVRCGSAGRDQDCKYFGKVKVVL